MSDRRCVCGHTHRQHEIRSGGLFGCYLSGCLCIDFADVEQFFWNGELLRGLCGHCGVNVDSTDPNHRVTSIVAGGRGVECVLRGDIHASDGGPLRVRS